MPCQASAVVRLLFMQSLCLFAVLCSACSSSHSTRLKPVAQKVSLKEIRSVPSSVPRGPHSARGISLAESLVYECNVTNSMLLNCDFSASGFENVNLSSILFQRTNMQSSQWDGVTMREVVIEGGQYRGMRIDAYAVTDLLSVYKEYYKDKPSKLQTKPASKFKERYTLKPQSGIKQSETTLTAGKQHMRSVRMSRSRFDNVKLQRLYVTASDFSHCTITDCSWRGVDVFKANLSGTHFINCNWQDAQIVNGHYERMTIDGFQVSKMITVYKHVMRLLKRKQSSH